MAVITKGIEGVVVHPQWGVPMGFHTLARVDFDFMNKTTYVTLSSYYSKAVLEAGGAHMYNVTVQMEGAALTTETALLEAIVAAPNSPLETGTVAIYVAAGAEA